MHKVACGKGDAHSICDWQSLITYTLCGGCAPVPTGFGRIACKTILPNECSRFPLLNYKEGDGDMSERDMKGFPSCLAAYEITVLYNYKVTFRIDNDICLD